MYDQNELRRLLQMQGVSEDMASLLPPNELAKLLAPEQPSQAALDMFPSGPNAPRNFLQRTNGPDAGKVIDLDQAIAQQRAEDARSSMSRGDSMGAGPMNVIGMGGGTTVNLGQQQAAKPNIDYSRPQLDTMGGKAYYSKDEPGVAYVLDANGNPKSKILLGYDMKGSMALNKARLADEATRANIAHTQEQIAASQQTRNTKEGIPGMGIPQSILEKQFGKAPDGKRWTMGGTLEDIPGGGGGKLTESQGKAAGLATRAQAAHDILSNFEASGVTTPSLTKQAAEGVPLVGGALAMGVNKLGIPSAAQNQVEQAQRDFVNAALRVESGASISQSEFDNARKQYFPQPGDSPEVIKQKQQAREREIKSLSIQAGPGAAQIRQVQSPAERAKIIFDAKKAVAAGAPRTAVLQRLQQAGITDASL